eukprot:6393491-Amphidinium_carterae.2
MVLIHDVCVLKSDRGLTNSLTCRSLRRPGKDAERASGTWHVSNLLAVRIGVRRQTTSSYAALPFDGILLSCLAHFQVCLADSCNFESFQTILAQRSCNVGNKTQSKALRCNRIKKCPVRSFVNSPPCCPRQGRGGILQLDREYGLVRAIIDRRTLVILPLNAVWLKHKPSRWKRKSVLLQRIFSPVTEPELCLFSRDTAASVSKNKHYANLRAPPRDVCCAATM